MLCRLKGGYYKYWRRYINVYSNIYSRESSCLIINHINHISFSFTRFFHKQHFFSTQPQYCLTFHEFSFTCYLIHKSIILRHLLYLLNLCQCLELPIYMSYPCALFFIFIFIFKTIHDVISWIQTYRHSFAYFLERGW